MSVAAAIEIGTGRGSGPGPALIQARTPGGISGAGLSPLGSARSSSASVSAANAGSGLASGSFHANWQAQLASLGGAIESLSSESREILDGPDAAEASGGEPAGNQASPTGLLISSLAAQFGPVSPQQVLSAVLPARPASDSRAPVTPGRTGTPTQADTPALPMAAPTASGGASSPAEAGNPAHKTKSHDAKSPSRAIPPFEAIATPPPGIVAVEVLASQSATPVAMDASPAVRFVDVGPRAAQARDSSTVPIWSGKNMLGVRPSDSSLPAQRTEQISAARTHGAPGSGIARAASASGSLTGDSPELSVGTGPVAAQGDAEVKVAEAVAFPESVNLEDRRTQPTGPAPVLGTAPSPGPAAPERIGVAPAAANVNGAEASGRAAASAVKPVAGGAQVAGEAQFSVGSQASGDADAVASTEAGGKQSGPKNELPQRQAGVAASASHNPSSEPAGGLPATLQGTGREVSEARWTVAAETGPVIDKWKAPPAEGAQTGIPSPSASPAPQAGQRTASGFPDAGSASPTPLRFVGYEAVWRSRLVSETTMAGNEPALENAGMSSIGAVSPEGTQRTTRGSITGSKSEHRFTPVAAQAAGVQGDTTGMMRDPSAAQLPIGSSDRARETPPGLAPRETFAALDSGSAPGAPTWTHAGARQAEAGFQDPALGWVGVRAEMSGGGVHAALVPGSAEASQELGRQMNGLHTYLAAQHLSVESLGLATPGGRGGGSSGDEGWNQQMQQNMQPGTGQGSGQQTYADAEAGPVQAGMGIDRPVAAQSSAAEMGGDRGVFLDGSRGNHISLMA